MAFSLSVKNLADESESGRKNQTKIASKQSYEQNLPRCDAAIDLGNAICKVNAVCIRHCRSGNKYTLTKSDLRTRIKVGQVQWHRRPMCRFCNPKEDPTNWQTFVCGHGSLDSRYKAPKEDNNSGVNNVVGTCFHPMSVHCKSMSDICQNGIS